MALWLNAKLKAYSDYHTSFWKQLAVLAPLFGALLIGCGVWIDCVSLSPLRLSRCSDRETFSSRKAFLLLHRD